jgi:hypothetical protein
MALGSNQPLTEMSTRNIPGGKGGRCVRLTTSQPSRAECHEICEPKSPGTPWVTPGLLRDCFTFTFTLWLSYTDTRTTSLLRQFMDVMQFSSPPKGAHYTAIKTSNYLPTDIQNVANGIRVFENTLKIFLLDKSFYLLMNILMLINDIHS